MFLQQQFQALFNYNWHINDRLLTAAEQLDEATLRENAIQGRGSIYGLFYHIYAATRSWRLGLETGQRPRHIEPDHFADLESVRENFVAEQAAWEKHLAGLEEQQIKESIELSWGSRTVSVPYWRVLQHLAFHAMQHHTELAQILTEFDQSPGDIDFIFFQWGQWT